MTKKELVKEISENISFSEKEKEAIINALNSNKKIPYITQRVIDQFINTVEEKVADNRTVMIKDFGKFYCKENKAHKGYNFKNKELMDVKSIKTITFDAGDGFKKKVRGQ